MGRLVSSYNVILAVVLISSSTYNTLEFSRLLDGTINDAKEIGINLISDADRALMLAEWGK